MYVEPLNFESPQWSGRVRQRLRVSLLLSTVCIGTMLLVLRFPVAGQVGPATELFVKILIEEVEPAAETAEDKAVQESLRGATSDETSGTPQPVDAFQEPATSTLPVDWYGMIPDAAKAAVARAAKTVSANPLFDEKRRQAAVKFAPSKAPQASPVWEKVEEDALGRTILQSGDCYHVIDDPNVGSREAFDTFGQFMTVCSSPSDRPRLLPWVSEIRNRRASPARSAPPAAE
jgi:hypothetical protein